MFKRFKVLMVVMAIAMPLFAQTAKVRVTYYNLKGKTAMGIQTRKGICAVSPDLEKKGFKLGEYVVVEGYGKFLIADRTAKRIKNTIDIWSSKPIKNGKDVKAKVEHDND